MLMHLMTFTEHRLPSVKTAPGFAAAPGSQEACLLQQLAQLDPQQLRPVLPTKKPDKERTNAQLHPLQQAAVQAGKARDAAWQQSRHLKREFKSIKNLQKKSKSWLLRRQLYSRPQPSMNSVAQGEGMLANYAAQHCVSRHS